MYRMDIHSVCIENRVEENGIALVIPLVPSVDSCDLLRTINGTSDVLLIKGIMVFRAV